MLWVILFLGILCFVLYKIWRKFYFIDFDHTFMVTGAPGTGKTNELVRKALKIKRILTRRVKFHNWKQRHFHKKDPHFQDKPQIFSNFPIRIGRYSRKEYDVLIDKLRSQGMTQEELDNVPREKFCNVYKWEYMVNQEALPLLAISVISEIGKFIRQYDWENENVKLHVNDHVSFYRQYTQGGYLLADDQSVEFVVKQIRLRFGSCLNMLHFHKFWKIYWQQTRNFTISEDFKVIEQEDTESSRKIHVGLFPLFHRNYDSLCWSDRYKKVPRMDYCRFLSYKTNEILQIPWGIKKNYQGQVVEDGVLPVKLVEKDKFRLRVPGESEE